jgi:hypothetical protein
MVFHTLRGVNCIGNHTRLVAIILCNYCTDKLDLFPTWAINFCLPENGAVHNIAHENQILDQPHVIMQFIFGLGYYCICNKFIFISSIIIVRLE